MQCGVRGHRRASFGTWLVALVAISLCGCSGGGSSAEFSQRQQSMLAYWQSRHDQMMASPGQVFSSNVKSLAYPAEVAQPSFVGARITGNAAYLADGVRQVEWAHTQENPAHLIKQPDGAPGAAGNPPLTASLGQSRLAIGYWLAWKTTGNATYVQWADDAFAALAGLQMTQRCWNAQCFDLFYYLYFLDPPNGPLGGVDFDPNQEAFHAVAATLLYFEPKSRFFHDATMATLAKNMMNAALVMMNASGQIPLTSAPQFTQSFDTRYGHATLMLVTWANHYWKDPDIDTKLKLGATWVAHSGANTLRYYPEFLDGPVPDPAELYYRLPVLYFYGGDRTPLEAALTPLWAEWQRADITEGFMTPFNIYEDMGIPQTEYWK